MKKQKKAKTGSSSTQPASGEAPDRTAPQIFEISSGSPIADSPIADSPSADAELSEAAFSDSASSFREEPRSGIRVRSVPMSSQDPMFATVVKCQQVYATARTTDASGLTRLDENYLAHALADAGIGALAEQTLYSLAHMAAADGHETLFEDDVIAALQVTAQAS